jgi:dihydropteroate synthase
MQDAPRYRNVVAEVADYLRLRRERLLQAGVELPRICLDPGIGFGKTHQHNLQLLAGSGAFLSLGTPILVGHSRKGFIGRVLGDADRPRDAGTVGAALAVARQGIQVLRVHDVQCVKDALELFDAAGGLDGAPRMLTDAKPGGTMNRAAPPASEPNP